ncbi:HAD family hydrolase [Sulfurovum sp.]|uniref:HAD family hydrolase n=1 Tax=Sulfurovum sp. TaxID=1969726 RepID=UPI0025DCF72C|nr:HAD family hydrolase [Sulfurovum sp.]
MKTVITLLFLGFALAAAAAEPLPSWNDGPSKHAIIHYVDTVTKEGSKDFIPQKDRIAVFDNDGTLWSEQPVYFQVFFAMDRVKALAPQHPEWKLVQPFKAVLEGDIKKVMASGKEGLLKLIMVSHTGMSDEEFDDIVATWIKTAKHPTKKVRFTELVFQPMLELLRYLRANDFKTFIVSGGGIDFMRPWATEVYGIPSNRIIGSEIEVKYRDRKIIRIPKTRFIDDKEGKPVGIHYHIGKRPVAAFGNSDGDLDMMKYTEANRHYKTLQLYVHHTDAKREWAYDRKSPIGKLDKGLDYARDHNWTVVDMKKEWKVIYPFELKH